MIKKRKLVHLSRYTESVWFILITFGIFSIISGLVMWKSNFMSNSVDIYFHLSRVYEIKQSILHGDGFPLIALNKFYQSGSAVMSIYPSYNLIPMVIMSFFVKSFINLIYIMFILRNFFAFIIAFYSCYTFSRQKHISYLFSVVYTLSSMNLHYVFFSMDLGVSTSLIFLPLVIFGTYNLINYNSWKQLSIGMSVIVLSHVITSLLSAILVLTILIINIGKIKKNYKEFFCSLLKAILTSILITSIFWVPFILIMFRNSIGMPNTTWDLTGIDFNLFLYSVMSNSPYSDYISIAAFIGIILSIINYKNMSSFLKQIFWISIALITISSHFFPWNILNETFLKSSFQRPWRLHVLAQPMLCYLFVYNAINVFKNKKLKIITPLLIIFFSIFLQVTEQRNVKDFYINNRYDISHVENDDQGLITDYLPNNTEKVSIEINKHVGMDESNKYVDFVNTGNGSFDFNLRKKTKYLRVPFIMYKGIEYKVSIDGRRFNSFYSDNNQMILKNVTRGKHHLAILIDKPKIVYLSYFLSFIGLMILLLSFSNELLKVFKRNKRKRGLLCKTLY